MSPTLSTPSPQLTLRLSSPSFLETVLTEEGLPVYSTETYENNTTLSRCDPYYGLSLVASIQWPHHESSTSFCKGKAKEFPSPRIFINGTSVSDDELLKRNFVNTSRKFRLPGHSVSFKWRRVQGVFQCVSSSGTPVAVFEPAILTARARITIYVNATTTAFSDVGDRVSTLLADYIVVTALLLTTHPQDWQGLRTSPPSPLELPVLDISADSPTSSSPFSPLSALSMPSTPLTATSISTSTSNYPHYPIPTPRLYTNSTHSHAHSQSLPSSEWGYQQQQSQQQFSRQEGRLSPRHASTFDLTSSSTFFDKQEDFLLEQESPPPYEEIQWTVRVRQPRRTTTTC
ncbi:hypothetical protein Clacol_000463 [Clathrus columnatus]|uniref:DUF6593 domain-containing protein n=1 Tax=Clathrus columnatus TaxID=1419009 RepID=A0AAV4ZWQ5_9AGAM|nr:hypothetical protein Clacol_000463 [Clathrus columnatus]